MARFIHDTKEGLEIAGRAVRANPLRSILTMLGIIIGIVTVTLMGAFLNGINDMFHSTVSFMGTDIYYVDKWNWGGGESWMFQRNRPAIKAEYASMLKERMSTAKAICVSTNEWGLDAKYKNEVLRSITAVGVDEAYQVTNSLNIEQGRFFSTGELIGARPVCVIGYEVANNLLPNQDPIGKIIRVGGYPVEIIGVVKKVGGLFGVFTTDKQVIMPLRTFFSAYGNPHRSMTLSIKARSVENREETKEEAEFYMRQIRGLSPNERNNFGINSQDQFNKQFDALTFVLNIVGYMITGLSLLVGGIGIMNIMFVSVRERTKEIGIRKAIGAKRSAILFQFLAEASIISLLGGLLSLMIAFPLSMYIDSQVLGADSPVHLEFPLSIAMLGLSLSIFTGITSGFLPAWRASKLNPVDALRYE